MGTGGTIMQGSPEGQRIFDCAAFSNDSSFVSIKEPEGSLTTAYKGKIFAVLQLAELNAQNKKPNEY
jgi:hypothetical protein